MVKRFLKANLKKNENNYYVYFPPMESYTKHSK